MVISTIVWLVLLVVFLAVEALTVGLISTWFAGGALIALLVSLIGGALWLQVLVFFTVSIVLLILLRPLVRKVLRPRLVKTNADSLIGSTCQVVEDIDNLAGTGRVKVGDVTWSARSEGGEKISAGRQVKILKIQGVKVYVEEVKKTMEVS